MNNSSSFTPLKIEDLLAVRPSPLSINSTQELMPDFAGVYETDHIIIQADLSKELSDDYFISVCQDKDNLNSLKPTLHIPFQDPLDGDAIGIRELTLLTILIDRLRSRQEIELGNGVKLIEARFLLEQASALLISLD